MDVRLAPGSTLGEGAPGLEWRRRDKNQFQLLDAFVAVRQGQCYRSDEGSFNRSRRT